MECRKEEKHDRKYFFPQVGDNELMLTEIPHMNLYDETDLIKVTLQATMWIKIIGMATDCWKYQT